MVRDPAVRRGWLAGLALALSLALLAATYAGPLHPLGDSLAVGRPLLAGVLLVVGVALRGRAGWLAAAAGALALAPMLWAARLMPVPEAPPALVVYQKNLRFTLADPAPIAADIRASGADVALLQEVSDRNLRVTAALADAYPHQAVCAPHPVGAVAVLSRWPFEGGEVCDVAPGMVAARILSPAGPVTVVSLHLHWPWPFGLRGHLERILPRLADLPRPVIVGGDFNAVPGSQTVRRVAEATGTRRAGPLRPSFYLKGLLPITIDHVFVPEGAVAATAMRPLLGSDHRGQRAVVQLQQGL